VPGGAPTGQFRAPEIKILESGVVGSLDYKIIEAGRADDLFQWLKDNKYSYAGDEASLNFYIQKKWLFTVMKIDTMQMKRNKDGTFDGEVTPTLKLRRAVIHAHFADEIEQLYAGEPAG